MLDYPMWKPAPGDPDPIRWCGFSHPRPSCPLDSVNGNFITEVQGRSAFGTWDVCSYDYLNPRGVLRKHSERQFMRFRLFALLLTVVFTAGFTLAQDAADGGQNESLGDFAKRVRAAKDDDSSAQQTSATT